MYADELYEALRATPVLPVDRLDYRAIYPAWLFPADHVATVDREEAILHWRRPKTWRSAAECSQPLLHIQYWSPFTSVMLRAVQRHAQALGKHVLVTVHNPAPHEKVPGFGHWERELIQGANKLILHTSHGTRLVRRRFGIDQTDAITEIPHGIRIRTECAVRAEDYSLVDLNPARSYVLTFGNLRAYKGIPTLLKAWRHVCQRRQDVDLVVAGRMWAGTNSLGGRITATLLGTDEVASELRMLLADPVLAGRVILKQGFVPDPVLDALCRISVLGVFAYDRMSAQSGAAARAAGMGLPLVVSEVSGLSDLSTGSECVVKPQDSAGLAAALLRLLSDRQRLQELRHRQRDHARAFEWSVIARRHMDLYQRMYAALQEAAVTRMDVDNPGALSRAQH
jgi:glycosyltransferase involved in cell wall biosynthesis